MSRGFNLTAEINLRGPANIRTVVADIRRQLGTINANVDVRINPATARNVTALNQALGRLNTTLSQTNVLASQVSAALNNLATAGTSAGTALRNIPTTVRNAATAVNQFNTNVNRATSTLAGSRTEFEEFGRQSALAVRRFAAFATVTGVIFKVNNAISSAFSEFVAFDKELVRVAQVTDSSVKSLASLESRITNLSTSFGVASKDLIQISSTLAQAGLSAKDTEKALRALALSALAPSFDSLNDTVEGSIALMRQFGIGAGDLEQALGSVNSVAAKFAVEASDIIAAIQRTGGVFAAASRGVSEGKDALNEFIAVFTSVRATTRESAETIATGLRTIFTRIQRASTIEALKEFGVNLTDVEGKFVGAYKAVELLSGGLSRLDPRDLRFSKIVEELGGFRQIGKVIPLIQEFATAQQALAVAQKGQGSLAADASTAQQALAVKIAKVREEFIGLIRSVSQSDSFQTFINLSLDLTSSLVKLADSAKVLLPALTAIAAIRGGSFLTQFATGFAGGLRRQNTGGAVRGFAVGGLVPGSGNTDTFPAMLTPGEFVIRKKAVDKIGISNLHRINKASGGYIPQAKLQSSETRQYFDGAKSQRTVQKAKKNQNSGKYIAPIVARPERAHIGGDLYIDQSSLVNYLEKYSATKLKRSIGEFSGTKPGMAADVIGGMGKKEYDKFIKEKLNLSVKKRIRLNFPSTFNQALRTTDPGVVLQSDLIKILSSSSNLTEPLGTLSASEINQVKQNVVRKVRGGLKALPASSYRKNLGWREGTPDSMKTAPAFDTDYQLMPLAKVIESSVNEKTKQRLQNNIDLLFKSSTKDASYISRRTGAVRNRTQSRESARLSTISKEYSNDPRNVQRREESYYDRALENAIWSLPKKRSRKKQQTTTSGYPRDYIAVHNLSTGGAVQRFADGGVATRNIGYIDSDVLNDPANKALVDEQIEKLKKQGIKIEGGYRGYKQYLSDLAAKARKEKQIGRLTSIVGLPGAGKSTMMMGSSQADNATMRKTTRFPILTPEDIARSSSVIDVTASVNPKKIDASLQASDRIVSLSSSTKEEQEELRRRRKLRNRQIEAGTSATGFGRRAGTTDSAPVDSGYIEAILQSEIKDPKKIRTLGVTPKGFRTKRGDDIPEILREKMNLYYGNFGPATAGHISAQQYGMKESAKRGISRSVVAVGIDTPVKPGDEHSTRSALLSQKERIALARKAFPQSSITAATKETFGFGLPSLYEIEKSAKGRRRFVKPLAGSTATVGDEKGSSSLQKYLDAGFDQKDIITLERLGGISGTKVREALLKGDLKTLKKSTSPQVFDILSRNTEVFQRRSGILPKIMERIGSRTTMSLSSIEAELAKYPSRLTPKIKAEHPEYEEIVANLRKQRDKIKAKADSRSGSTMRRLSRMFPSQYGLDIGGPQQLMAGSFAKVGAGGRKKRERLTDITLAEAQQKTASDIIGELTITGAQQVLERAGGVGVSPQTLLRKLKLTSDESRLKNSVLSAYVEKVNSKAKAARERDLGATTLAQQTDSLFGAVGMFGSSFPAEDVTIENGLKEPKTVRVFGQVLDKNKAAKQLRLSKVAKGSKEYAGISSAPTAIALNKAYTKEELSGVRKRNNDRIIKTVLSELSGGTGTKAFFDFDKTLAFGADKIGPRSAAKKLDYTSFGDPKQVEAGLAKARPSTLLLSLKKLVRKVQKNIPDQLPSLLSNMYVVSARPPSTMPLISKWLMSKGLPIPASNIRGVGGSGLSDKAVAVNKADTIVSLSGTSKGLFVDDNTENVTAVSGKGISSYTYGQTVDMDRASKKAIADSQGGKFQNDLNVELKRSAPSLYAAMANESEIHRSIDFPYGLGSKIASDWFSNPLLATSPVDAKRTLTGPRGKLLSNITNYLKFKGFAVGGSVTDNNEDTVPALLTPGEFVINRKAAKRIGAARLHQLNRADRVQGLNKGGSVGPQRFFLGGGASARPGDNANINNLMVPPESLNELRLMITALEELGVTSSRSADLIRKGGRASVQAAHAAYEADIVRLRIAGAPMQAVIQAETQLANMRRQADRQIIAQRQLSGVSGERLQRIDTRAQNYIQRKIASRQARGEDISEDDMMQIQNRAYRREAKRQGLSSTQMAGLSGNDLRQFINSAMGDPKTFEAMNRSFETNRKQEILRQINAERGVTNDKREIANRSKEARRLAREESDARRKILNETRGAAGPGSRRSERISQGMFGASFVLPMAAQMLAGDPSKAESASAARSSAAIQGAANTFSMGAMMTSMIPPGLPQAFALLATSAASIGQAFIDAKNATIEFEKNLANKKIESALEKTGILFEKLSKDLSNIDIQKQITSKLIEANDAAIRSIDIQAKTAKAFWINFLDAFANDGIAASQRSQIAEKYGTSAYFDTTAFGQNPLKMMFNATSGTLFERLGMVDFKDEQNRADLNRAEYTNRMMPEQARDISKQFSPIAENAIRLIEEKIRGGTKIEDILSADDFDKLSRSIAMANATIAEQVLSVRNNLILTDDQKKAQEELIIQTYAESEAKKRAAIISREIEMREARKATSKLSRSLERMFQNMEQSINATNFALENMTKDLDLVSASLQGQAKLGESSLNSINVLQNPKAYSSRDFDKAANQASGFFGNSGGIIKGLLTLGNDIESTIMGTINRTISNSKDPDNQEKLAIEIEKAVKDKLAGLDLPDDISEKLAREVKASLDQLRKEGDQKIDFSQLEERIQDLSKVFDSAKKAQEIAIKALENWDNALNSFTRSMNTLVDLEVEYQSRLRRSHELQIGAQTELSKALGKEISVRDVINNRNSIVGEQTGGATIPEDIANNINILEERRRQQEAASNVARQQGPASVKDFEKFQRNLVNTNTALRENYDALKSLAENSDVASAALGKIQEAQQRQQGRVGFIEKLVTSTPEEFESLNRAFFRLQRNIDGQLNTINTSVGAQKAYNEAISGGANAMQAMRAAQAAFANERKDTLSALSDLLPFLGSGQTANNARANTLEAMLKESGMGVSPMMNDILNSLRNPESDPETQQAIQLYNEANNLQVKANESLAEISRRMQDETSDKAAKAIADALSSTILTFKLAEQKDINQGLVPQNKAYGGIIYASAGTFAAKGTDTVPAMLTPGEFVVNRNATAKNLPLLRSINNNHYSSGGKVRYYAGGGYVSSLLSADATNEDDFKESKEKFIKLDSDRIREVASNNSKLYKMPNIYLQTSDAAKGQTPDKTSFADQAEWGEGRDFRPMAGRRKAGIYDFTQIYDAHSNGEILPGYVQTGFKISSGYYGEYPEDTKLNFRNILETPTQIDDTNIVLGLTKDKRDIPLDTESYKAQQFNFYREKAKELKLQELANRISWADNPNNVQIGREILSAADYPTTINPTSNTKSKLIPHGVADSVLFASENNLIANPKYGEYATIWANKSSVRKAFAVTTGKNPPEFNDALAGGEQFTQYRAMRSVVYEKPKDGLIRKDERDDIISYNQTQYKAIKRTVEAIKELNKLEMVESTDSTLYNKIQESLSNLYNNRTVSETFEGKQMSLFPSLLDEKSLSVVAGDDESRQSILKFIESKIVGLKAGDKPKFNGENIKIGISKIPAAFNKDLLEGWVENKEFDIDDPKKSGIKRFPYLVNLSPSDISKTFVERAKDAAVAAAAAGPITTSIVPYNGQVSIDTGGGKEIDLPYSAIYTKYNGPLWDEKIKGFSKKKLDMYLANSANDTIFSSLDTSTHALAAKKELDLNDKKWVSLKYPVKNVEKLLELYKEDKPDQNLIDKEIAAIKGSTIDVRHDNAPFGKMVGSLIKSAGGPMMGGADLFSGWSNLDSTNFGFGEFLVEALKKYAANTQGEAKKVVGKAADDKFGQDVLANSPAEFVNALKAVTLGALNIFGRRQIPGVSGSWFARNGGARAFALLKNNRVNMQQGKGISGFLMNAISNAGAYVSNISSRVTDPRLYNNLKDLYTIMWGGYETYKGFSTLNTRSIVQLLKNSVDAFGNFTATPQTIEDMFRSLGASASFTGASTQELPEDYKAILGDQLQGSKIRTVDSSGRITEVTPANIKYKNYGDLMNLAINPYNEYTSRDIRKGIISKLINDISSAKDFRGGSFFDPRTQDFLLNSLGSLQKWYSGNGRWLGQDYLYDKQANPDPKDRAEKFQDSLAAAVDLWSEANTAHRNLGAAAKFGGDLPNSNWFKNRIEAGNFATGGMVYAAGGTLVNFQPRGTDTVPAMLTPGEFVVNRSATQKHLPLLKQINDNKYLASGGLLGKPRVVQGVTLEPEDTITPKIDNILKTTTSHSSTLISINKNIQELDNRFKNSSKTLMTNIDNQRDKLGLLGQNLNNKLTRLETTISAIPMYLDNIMGGTASHNSSGGIVYASQGKLIPYSPKGTDTVPAMLTPGEFVINKAATARNLPLLQNINSGNYSTGGIVDTMYYAKGTGRPVPPTSKKPGIFTRMFGGAKKTTSPAGPDFSRIPQSLMEKHGFAVGSKPRSPEMQKKLDKLLKSHSGSKSNPDETIMMRLMQMAGMRDTSNPINQDLFLKQITDRDIELISSRNPDQIWRVRNQTEWDPKSGLIDETWFSRLTSDYLDAGFTEDQLINELGGPSVVRRLGQEGKNQELIRRSLYKTLAKPKINELDEAISKTLSDKSTKTKSLEAEIARLTGTSDSIGGLEKDGMAGTLEGLKAQKASLEQQIEAMYTETRIRTGKSTLSGANKKKADELRKVLDQIEDYKTKKGKMASLQETLAQKKIELERLQFLSGPDGDITIQTLSQQKEQYQKLESLKPPPPPVPAKGFRKGGVVYAQDGTAIPPEKWAIPAGSNLSLDELEARIVYGNKVLEENDIKYLRDTYLNNNGGTENKDRAYSILMHSADNEFALLNLDDTLRSSIDTYMQTGKQPDVKMSDSGILSREDSMREGGKPLNTYFRPEWVDNRASASANNRGLKEYPRELLQIEEQVNSALSASGKPASWRLPDSLLQAYSEKNEKLLNLQLDKEYADAPLQAMVIGASKAIAPSLAAIGAGAGAASGGLGAVPTIGLSIIAGQVASWLQESMLNKIAREKNEEWNIISDRNRFASLAGSTAGGMLATTAALGPNSFRAIGTQTLKENLLSRATSGGLGASIDLGLQKGLGLMVGQAETDWNSVLLSAIAGGVQPTMGQPEGGLIGALSKQMDPNIVSSRVSSLQKHTHDFGGLIAGSPTASKTIKELVASMDPKARSTVDSSTAKRLYPLLDRGQKPSAEFLQSLSAAEWDKYQEEFERVDIVQTEPLSEVIHLRSRHYADLKKNHPELFKKQVDQLKDPRLSIDSYLEDIAVSSLLRNNSLGVGTKQLATADNQINAYKMRQARDERYVAIQAIMRRAGDKNAEPIVEFLRVDSAKRAEGRTDSSAYELLLERLGNTSVQRGRWYFPTDAAWTPESLRAYLEFRAADGLRGGKPRPDDPGKDIDFSTMIDPETGVIDTSSLAGKENLLQLRKLELPKSVAGHYKASRLKYISENGGGFAKDTVFDLHDGQVEVYKSLDELAEASLTPDREFIFPGSITEQFSEAIRPGSMPADLQQVLKSRKFSDYMSELRRETGRAATTEEIPAAIAAKEKEAAERAKLLEEAQKEYIRRNVSPQQEQGVNSPLSSPETKAVLESGYSAERVDSGAFMRDVKTGFKQFFGGSSKKKSFTGLYDKVAKQLAADGKLAPELSIESLRATLGTEAEKRTLPRTLADFARIMGLPLDKIMPKDLETIFDPDYRYGGSYGSNGLVIKSRQYPSILRLLGRSVKSLASGKPLDDKSLGMTKGQAGNTVYHEATHMVFDQLEDVQYNAFNKKMKNNMGSILEYMSSRPDIFQGYDQADVGGAFYYLTRLITGKDVNHWNRQTNLTDELNAFRSGHDLPLTLEQKTKVDQYKRVHEQWKKGSRTSPPPAGDELISIPNFPPLSVSDILPAGSRYMLDPNSYAARSSRAMKDIVDVGVTAGRGGSPDIDSLSASLLKSFKHIKPEALDSQIGYAREEFVAQMMENIDRLDKKGLSILTELFEASFLNDPNVFDGNAFYERARNTLNQRKDVPTIDERSVDSALPKAMGGLISPFYYAGGTRSGKVPPVPRSGNGAKIPRGGHSVPPPLPKRGFGARISDFVGKTLGSMGLGSSKPVVPKSTIHDQSYYYDDKGYGYGPLSLYELERKYRVGSLSRFTKISSDKLAAGKFPKDASIGWVQLKDFLDNHPLANELPIKDGFGNILDPLPPKQTAQRSGPSVPPPIPRQTAQRSGSSVPPPIPRQTAQRSGSSVPPQSKSSQDQAAARARAEATARAKAEADARARAKAEAEARARAEAEKKRRTQEQRDAWTRSSRGRSSSMSQLDEAYQFFGIQGIKTGDIGAFHKAYYSFAKKNHPDIATDKTAAEAAMKKANAYKVMIQRAWEAQGFTQKLNRGGMVYASEGKLIDFQPRGTDTVPAMLTPGEFVVNAKATARHLPLLKAINKSKGGVVYAQFGMEIPRVVNRRDLEDKFGGPQIRPLMPTSVTSAWYEKIAREQGITFQSKGKLAEDLLEQDKNGNNIGIARVYEVMMKDRMKSQAWDRLPLMHEEDEQYASRKETSLFDNGRPLRQGEYNPWNREDRKKQTDRINSKRRFAGDTAADNMPRDPGGDILKGRRPTLDEILSGRFPDPEGLSLRQRLLALKKQAEARQQTEKEDRRAEKIDLNKARRGNIPAGMNKMYGGMIYADKGMLIPYEPKGTDTVPAMLTPGEFVVNAKSTSKHLPLLKAINKNNGGMVNYLAGGGQPFAQNQDKDAAAGMGKNGIKEKTIRGQAFVNKQQIEAAKANRTGQLWVFEENNRQKKEDEKNQEPKDRAKAKEKRKQEVQGNATDVRLLMKNKKFNERPLTSINLEKSNIYTTRANDARNAKKNIINDLVIEGDGLPIPEVKPITAQSALTRAKRELSNRSIGRRLLESLSYQLDTSPDHFEVKNPDAYNENVDIDKKVDEIANTIIKWKDNPGLINLEGQKTSKKYGDIINRYNDIQAVYKNASQALAILRKENLGGVKDYPSFDGKTADEILTTQTTSQTAEGLAAKAIIDKLKNHNDAYVRQTINDPRFVAGAGILPAGAWAQVDVSHFEGTNRVPIKSKKLNRGGIVYASSGGVMPSRNFYDPTVLKTFGDKYEQILKEKFGDQIQPWNNSDILENARFYPEFDRLTQKEFDYLEKEHLRKKTQQLWWGKKNKAQNKNVGGLVYLQDGGKPQRPRMLDMQVDGSSLPKVVDETTDDPRVRERISQLRKQKAQMEAFNSLKGWSPLREPQQTNKLVGMVKDGKMTPDEAKKAAVTNYIDRKKREIFDIVRYKADSLEGAERIERDHNKSISRRVAIDRMAREQGLKSPSEIKGYLEVTAKLNKRIDDNTKLMDQGIKIGKGEPHATSWLDITFEDLKTLDPQTYKELSIYKRFGGIVYANNGMLVPYQPKGTDTVPAMLTPGEFVVNRSSTQKNLSLLHAINAGTYSKGGVAYLQNGGLASNQNGQNSNQLSVATNGFVQALDLAVRALKEYQQQLSETKPNSVSNNNQLTGLDGLGQFVTKFDSFIQSLSKLNLPPIISLQVAPITLNITGGEALKQALEGPMSATLRKEIDDAFARLSAATEGALRT